MEADDEIKNVKGTSYDFGARLYDPRVGRWLSVDPLASKQPDQSPYKAMLNNPIYWADPDGETEYETIIIKDEASGTMFKIYRALSAKIMTDGKNNGYFKQHYYDYRHVTTYTIKADGSVAVTAETEVLYRNGLKLMDPEVLDYMFGAEGQEGDTYDPETKGYLQAGGWYMTGKNGEGTKCQSKSSPEMKGNMDDLIDLLSTYSASGKFKVNDKGLDNQQAWDGIQELMDQISHNIGKVGKIKELIPKISDAVEEVQRELSGGTSGEIPGNKKTLSNRVYPDPASHTGTGTERPLATPQERMNGDTLNGKPDRVFSKPQGQNKDDK